jgi:transposase InsO family protein
MCQVYGVSPSGFYAWCQRSKSQRAQEDEMLLEEITRIFKESRQTYGSPRMLKELNKRGYSCGINRIARIMRENDIVPITKKKFKKTTNSDHKRPVAENLVKQQFSAESPDALWTGDITYIRTVQGWLYLAVVLDVYSRKIVGWSMNKRMTDQLVIDAFMAAWWRRKPITKGLIFHSDRGSQYCSKRFRKILKERGCLQSMSATGCCYDNAITETFFHTLKTELVFHEQYQTRNHARRSIFDYIENFYNGKRIHSAIGYASPNEFEKQYKKAA